MPPPALLSAALLLLLLPPTLTEDGLVPIKVVVVNSLLDSTPLDHTAQMKNRGTLLGAMRRLMEANTDFEFTYTEDPDYGPYLESVNGLAGNPDDHTYWELLVKKPDGSTVRPDVGIGCYIPSENEQIILNFTKW